MMIRNSSMQSNIFKLISLLILLHTCLTSVCLTAPLTGAKQPEVGQTDISPIEKLESKPSESNVVAIDLNGNSDVLVQPEETTKLKRDTKNVAKESSLDHLDTQETGYLHNPAPYHSSDGDYGYDSGKNVYGKQASDWSHYDQGNHGLYDKYGDKAWNEQGHNGQSNHGKHDSYGNTYNSQNSGHGSGYYSRDRGYGYEKHYAYDKEVASKQHADNHNAYGSNHGLHDYYGNSASNSHGNQGHDRYGQLSRYGNHGYGKRGSNLAAHHDYGHNNNKAHYYTQSASPSYSQNYQNYHVPTYRSSYTDYSPQVGYPSSYPSYY